MKQRSVPLRGWAYRLCVVLPGFAAIPGAAAELRDPTQPPLVMRAAPAANNSGTSNPEAQALSDLGLAVMVRDGTPYVASGTRLYAVGQRVGTYQIERISETEVWLRVGKELKKIPRFAGIVRRAAASERSTP